MEPGTKTRTKGDLVSEIEYIIQRRAAEVLSQAVRFSNDLNSSG